MTPSSGVVDSMPDAVRPELTGGGGSGPSGPLSGRYGGTSLRVGAATMWLSIIVLLPLAAILWQSAGGGWDAFWSAVSSPAAVASFKVTLTISVGVAIVNSIFGLLVAWVLTRDEFPVSGWSTP